MSAHGCHQDRDTRSAQERHDRYCPTAAPCGTVGLRGLEIPEGTDRAHVRAYATWQVAHQLARSPQRSQASLKYAKSRVAEAVKLVVFLHDRHLELADLRQDLLDEWLATGSVNRRRIRPFVQWLARAGVAGPGQDPGDLILGQPRRKDAAGGAGAHDDEVVCAFGGRAIHRRVAHASRPARSAT